MLLDVPKFNIKNIEKFQFTKYERRLGLFLFDNYNNKNDLENISKQIDFLLQMRWIDAIYSFITEKNIVMQNFENIKSISDYKRLFFIYDCDSFRSLAERTIVLCNFVFTDSEDFMKKIIKNLDFEFPLATFILLNIDKKNIDLRSNVLVIDDIDNIVNVFLLLR